MDNKEHITASLNHLISSMSATDPTEKATLHDAAKVAMGKFITAKTKEIIAEQKKSRDEEDEVDKKKLDGKKVKKPKEDAEPDMKRVDNDEGKLDGKSPVKPSKSKTKEVKDDGKLDGKKTPKSKYTDDKKD